MKNSNGFTLIELLAIIVILAIIMVLAAPNMTKQIKRSEEESQNILNQKIENASKLYAAKYYANKLVNYEDVTFTLNDLQQDGLINLKDNCSSKINANIIIENGNYDYSGIESDDCYKLKKE